MVLLSAYVAIVGWVFYEQSTAWPHQGSWASLVFVFLCPGILFQSFSLAYTRSTGRPLKRRAWTRVVTIPMGLLLAVQLATWASVLAMRGFEQAYAPFVSQVGMNLAKSCSSAVHYFEIPAVANYNRRTGRDRPAAKLNHDNQRFVLSFSGGSIDIDGSTIYFDSRTRTWQKFHNDHATASEVFAKLTDGLDGCDLRAP